MGITFSLSKATVQHKNTSPIKSLMPVGCLGYWVVGWLVVLLVVGLLIELVLVV